MESTLQVGGRIENFFVSEVENLFLSKEDINKVIEEIDEHDELDERGETIITRKLHQEGRSRSYLKEVLGNISYNPDFDSTYYDGESIKDALDDNVSKADIKKALLKGQLFALIFEWGKGYIDLGDLAKMANETADMSG